MIYAGIGSRETPEEVCVTMSKLAYMLGHGGHVLRSGAANGADSAFESKAPPGQKEIFLPWHGFNDRSQFEQGVTALITEVAFDTARSVLNAHPSEALVRFMARNSQIILGWSHHKPVNVVVCWTPQGKKIGGTGNALRMAEKKNIPIINLGDYQWTGAPIHVLLKEVLTKGEK